MGFLAHQLHLAQFDVRYQPSATLVEAGEVFGVLLDVLKKISKSWVNTSWLVQAMKRLTVRSKA